MRSSSVAGVDREAGTHQRAQPVAREQHDRPASLGVRQRLRMLHVGGGEHLGALAAGDLVLERPGRAELRSAP